MSIQKSESKHGKITDKPDTRRRSFMWKIGAAVPAALAAAVPGRSSNGNSRDTDIKNRMARLSRQIGILEDEKSVRELHRTYESLLDSGRYEEVTILFTDDAEVIFNGGMFQNRSGGIQRLYCRRFRSGLTGKRMDPAPGFRVEPDTICISADRKSAIASFSYSIQVGSPIVSDSLLVKMARLHGEGIMKWWEGGKYEVSYVKSSQEGDWKIKKLQYRTLSKASYRPGKSRADPITVSGFSVTYPADPTGPDKLLS